MKNLYLIVFLIIFTFACGGGGSTGKEVSHDTNENGGEEQKLCFASVKAKIKKLT